MSTRTIPALLGKAAASRGDGTFLIFEGDEYSFAWMNDRARAAAATLLELGIKKSDRVAVVATNHPEIVITWFALALVGAAMVPLDPRSKPHDLSAAIQEIGPPLVLSDRERRPLAKAAVAETGMGREPQLLEEVGAGQNTFSGMVGEEDDIVVMLPTSGTTGSSKFVMQTNRAMVLAGEGFPYWVGLNPEDRLLTALPLWHLNALAYSVLGALVARSSLVLLPRFSAGSFISEAAASKATVFNAVGAQLEILMRAASKPDDKRHLLRLCYVTPAPPTKQRHLEIEDRFGFRITAGYGLSETPYGMAWPPMGTRPYGSMGALKEHPDLGAINEARIVGEDGRDVAPGEPGELLLRNPAVMKGYFAREAETIEVLRDGWLRTGDVVRRDENGTFYFVSRKKDLIRRRGENVSPQEIEEVLRAHPNVVEAAALGVPSALGEEDIEAFVTTDGASLEVADLLEWAAERLSPHKVPSRVHLVADMPHTATGRVAKHLLVRPPNV
ncbi:MAG: carnitine-CoA ligase [Actinomycetota bacterium]|nr:carnitine-CoA ligase [Actinomycetota bacterium]